MSTPTISIIVPVYNASPYLRQCLDSILAQTFRDFEAILVNDGSTDDSLDICRSYAQRDSRFLILDKENSGVFSSLIRTIGLLRMPLPPFFMLLKAPAATLWSATSFGLLVSGPPSADISKRIVSSPGPTMPKKC